MDGGWTIISILASIFASVIGGLVLGFLADIRRNIKELWEIRAKDQERCSEIHRQIARELGYMKAWQNSHKREDE